MNFLAKEVYRFTVSLCSCSILTLTSCTKTESTAESSSRYAKQRIGAIEVIAQGEGGLTNYVIIYQQGRYVFGIGNDSLSMTTHEGEGITARFNATNGSILSSVLTRQTNDGVERVIDFNADGIPDKKVVGNPPVTFLNYEGSFWPAGDEENGGYHIMSNGERVEVFFDGNVWQRMKKTDRGARNEN